LKPERWGSPLVQEKYWEEKACDKRHNNNNNNNNNNNSFLVLCGCENWSLKLREERRLRVYARRVLRGKFEPKSYEVTGEWRKLHNEENNGLYCSPNIVWVIKSKKRNGRGI